MSRLRKILAVTGIGLMIATGLTGCSGALWNSMKQQGDDLMQQGKEINEQLSSEAEEVNTQWKTVFVSPDKDNAE